MKLHVGRGTDRGPLSVFPIWAEGVASRDYVTEVPGTTVAEAAAGPRVDQLVVSHHGTRPLLMLEGQILEGGWQHRMLARSVMVPARAATELPVVCVEQGRWRGGRRHANRGRRAGMRVRNASRDVAGGRDQGQVWQRVAEYDARYGGSDTGALTAHLDRSAQAVTPLVDGLQPLPGQVGVLVGVAGQPVMVEIFDHPRTLRAQFDSIVRAAGLDALGAPAERTPSRRAIRFVDRLVAPRLTPVAPAGVGTTVTGATPYAAVEALAWHDRVVHLTAVNPRHPLNNSEVMA